MNPLASRLIRRVLFWQLGFALFGGLLVALLAPRLLLLSGAVALEGALALGIGVLAGGSLGALLTYLRLLRYRFVLLSLAVGSRAVEAHELYALGEEPRRTLLGWLLPSAFAAGLATIPLSPRIIDGATGVTLFLLGLAIVSAASLPLFVVLRTNFARALALSPPELMREVVEDAERLGSINRSMSRRMVVAVSLPVVCLALGALLIVAAHVRRADERGREETARMLSRAVLEPGPGLNAMAGIEDALVQARALGFYAYFQREGEEYRVEHGKAGQLVVTTPLDRGAVSMEFSSSTTDVVNPSALLVALAAVAVATLFGLLLGRALGLDLTAATRDVRELGTEAVLEGGRRVVRSARFRAVAQLGSAIARLAGRFRVFARAQERAIEARNAATRMRGLFFASVSHDLKSPLNAILGFTELVRRAQPVTPGQSESLALIERRGRELLALIETILDAARVEAGQLTLVLDELDPKTVIEQAVAKGRDLGGDRELQVVLELAPSLPRLKVDRVLLPRALATFVACAMREAVGTSVRIVAGVEPGRRVRVEIEMPGERFRTSEIRTVFGPPRAPGADDHRGLALALRLGRSIIELHGGDVELVERPGSSVFFLYLPAEA